MEISNETKEILSENGYDSLEEYYQCLAEDFDTDINTVEALAEILGESELFDGLPVSLEDNQY